ncbi:MAG: penicillin-binding protein 1C [Thermodesulfobacteriota bacterium]
MILLFRNAGRRLFRFIRKTGGLIPLGWLFIPLAFPVLLFFVFSGKNEPVFQAPYSQLLLDQNGELLGAAIADDDQWRFPPAGQVPERFVDALLLFEDRRFHRHPGVDPLALARAVKQNILAGKKISGASTITMQVIRLSRPGRPRSFVEKIIEMLLALRLETRKSKAEILSLYAAHAPFGGNVVGIEAAAWRFFGHAPGELTWAEAAVLAVLPNSPGLIHPGKNPHLLMKKRNRLLMRLQEKGRIDELTCRLAMQEPLPDWGNPIPNVAPHLLERVKTRRKLAGGSNQDAAAARLQTSLVKELQVAATEILVKHHLRLRQNRIENAAALILDVKTGNVLAYIGNVPGSRNHEHANCVDIIMARRSTGSILKPLLYAGMLDSGEMLPATLFPDVPTRLGGFAPQNFGKTYQGAVTAATALIRSLNVPAVRMLQSYGVGRFCSLLKSVGMTTLHRGADEYGLAVILGGAEGRLWEITGIYAGLARLALSQSADPRKRAFFPPAFIPAPVTALHHDPARTDGELNSPLSPAAAWLTLNTLSELVRPEEEGDWRSFKSAARIAWKTGTSYGFRDGWAVGTTARHAVGVWVGNADGEGRPDLTGIHAAAPILFDLFRILGDQPWFYMKPKGLVTIQVCAHSGHRAGMDCAETRTVPAPKAGLGSAVCPYCRTIHCDGEKRYRLHSKCARIADLQPAKWFVLPPAMEWYYRKCHSDYKPLPPFRNDCREVLPPATTTSMCLLYPGRNDRIYVPLELGGDRGRTVFQAAHRDLRAAVYWHLDENFIGSTREIHHMALMPSPGPHILTLVDENGERLVKKFVVLDKQ